MIKRQRGVTLIELMIALSVGLLLTLTGLQVFLTSNQVFALQETLTELNDDGQIALRYMVADIRQAGLGSEMLGTVTPVATAEGFNMGIYTPATTENGAGNDSLIISYWGDKTCAGQVLPKENPRKQKAIQTVYSVSDTGVLQCSSYIEAEDAEELEPVNLISGVEAFQVRYGIDDRKDGVVGITKYVDANELARLGKESSVVAIRFSLLLSSERSAQGEAVAKSYWLLGKKIETEDAKIRRVYTTTVQVRNFNGDEV